MTLKWDYKKHTCDISMPGYVANILSKFQHANPKQLTHAPSKYITPVYSANIQYAIRDETPPLNAKQCINIQRISGSVLYYGVLVDPTVCMPLNEIIAIEQTNATEKMQAETDQLLDYLAMHPDAKIRHQASYMILHIHSDASYLSVPMLTSVMEVYSSVGANHHMNTKSMAPSSMHLL
jgi:hypothetical protein